MFAGLPSSGLRTVRGDGQHAKAQFLHLEKPKVRILDYPMMGESSGASLWQMGDA